MRQRVKEAVTDEHTRVSPTAREATMWSKWSWNSNTLPRLELFMLLVFSCFREFVWLFRSLTPDY